MMKFYKLRVDTNDKEELYERLKKYSDTMIVSIENIGLDNVHCHCYFESTTSSLTIRQMIRKHYGSGNGVYSMKELDEPKPIEYISYCIKEGNQMISPSFDSAFIRECNEWNARVKSEIKTKKENKKTVLDKIIEHYDYENKKELWIPQVVDDVLLYYKENKILVREFQIKSQIQTILLRYQPTYQKMFKDQILDSLTYRK